MKADGKPGKVHRVRQGRHGYYSIFSYYENKIPGYTQRGPSSLKSRAILTPLSLCVPLTIKSRVLIYELWELGWNKPITGAYVKCWVALSGDLLDALSM